MAFEILVPRLGWTMEQGTFRGWLKKDGDAVRAGEPLFEIETDKATQEVETVESGILRIPPGSPEPGATVAVGMLLAYLVRPGEEMPAPAAAPEPAGSAEAPPAAAPSPGGRPVDSPEPPARAGPGRPLPSISPRALRKAAELGVDWTRIRGSGREGRIVEKDVLAAAGAEPGST